MILKFYSKDLGKIITKLVEFAAGEDCKYVLEINKSKNKRSLNQNKYYWGVVITIFADYTGYLKEECHQILTEKFLQYTKSGREFTRSSKQLDTKEFEEYVKKCRMWLYHEHQLHIPLPNEVTEEMWIELSRKQTVQ